MDHYDKASGGLQFLNRLSEDTASLFSVFESFEKAGRWIRAIALVPRKTALFGAEHFETQLRAGHFSSFEFYEIPSSVVEAVVVVVY